MVRVPCLKLVGDFSNSAKLQGKRVFDIKKTYVRVKLFFVKDLKLNLIYILSIFSHLLLKSQKSRTVRFLKGENLKLRWI